MVGLVLEMLNYYSERWSTLVIYLPPRLLSHLRGVSPDAPALERLRLNYLEDRKTATNSSFHPASLPPNRRNWRGHIILFQHEGCGSAEALENLFVRSMCSLRSLAPSEAEFTESIVPVLRKPRYQRRRIR